MKKFAPLICILLFSGCVVAPAYAPPPGYPGSVAYEYYPDYNYYYGAPYPAAYGSYGFYDWGYWHGYGPEHEHWGHYQGRGGHWSHR